MQSVCVLLVEDNSGDVELMIEVIEESEMSIDLQVVEDGQKALDFLRRKEGDEQAPQPDIVLLDLNLPRCDGHEVLAEIKADERLAMIPVVVLTASESEADVLRSYALHANCYITKPVDFDQFVKVMHTVYEFWFTVVKLPFEMDAL